MTHKWNKQTKKQQNKLFNMQHIYISNILHSARVHACFLLVMHTQSVSQISSILNQHIKLISLHVSIDIYLN